MQISEPTPFEPIRNTTLTSPEIDGLKATITQLMTRSTNTKADAAMIIYAVALAIRHALPIDDITRKEMTPLMEFVDGATDFTA